MKIIILLCFQQFQTHPTCIGSVFKPISVNTDVEPGGVAATGKVCVCTVILVADHSWVWILEPVFYQGDP